MESENLYQASEDATSENQFANKSIMELADMISVYQDNCDEFISKLETLKKKHSQIVTILRELSLDAKNGDDIAEAQEIQENTIKEIEQAINALQTQYQRTEELLRSAEDTKHEKEFRKFS